MPLYYGFQSFEIEPCSKWDNFNITWEDKMLRDGSVGREYIDESKKFKSVTILTLIVHLNIF